MAASISADTTRERLGQQLEDLLRSGHYEELHLLLESQLRSRPDDRELRLYQLLFVIKAEGVAAHEREIEDLRNLTELSDREREVIRQIFILGFAEAQREGIEEKSWAYQRLARRLVLHQSLLAPLPRVHSGDTGDSERRKQAADDSTAPSTGLFAGPDPRAWAFKGNQNLPGSGPLIAAVVGLAAVLTNYAPIVWNQNRSGFGNAPAIATRELIEHQPARTTEAASKAGPSTHDEAKVSSTNKGANKEKNISGRTVGIKVAKVKVSKLSPVPDPREEPASKGPAGHPSGELKESALETYQTRVDVRLREEPRFGSPRGATIKKGTLINGIDLNRDWLRIKVPSDGSTGFIRKEFVVPVSSTEPR
jgi:hypothetical protein